MLRNVHIKLTLLCAGITIFIMFLTSCLYLGITEKNLKESSLISFQSDINTLLANLDTQTEFTHEWFSKIEGNGQYLISIQDNGTEFVWGHWTGNPERWALLQAGWNYYNQHVEPLSGEKPFTTTHVEFSFPVSGQGKPDYYASVALSNRRTGTLSILILKPLAPLYERLYSQRLTFLILIAAASLVLFVFSYYFTGRLLRPIEENRQKQIQFTAAASHELRTPLSVILSASSACQKAAPSEQPVFFDIIKREGADMSRLISDLLTMAGADAHAFSIETQRCEPDTLLLDTYEAFEPLAKEKGYSLSVLLPDEKTAPLQCDAQRIRQVLSILLHNAFHYTPPGSSIILSLEQNEKKTFLRVSDNGPGVPDSQKERIFERFRRADETHSGTGHFGLGLSIAKEIVTAHKGRITVSDSPGGGAAFTIALPHGNAK